MILPAIISPPQYAYDALDNLTTVTQGLQTRTFVYDSLRRLTSASNPESGTINYEYGRKMAISRPGSTLVS